MSTLDHFYSQFTIGPHELINALITTFQVLTVQTDSLQRRYDELLLLVI